MTKATTYGGYLQAYGVGAFLGYDSELGKIEGGVFAQASVVVAASYQYEINISPNDLFSSDFFQQ